MLQDTSLPALLVSSWSAARVALTLHPPLPAVWRILSSFLFHGSLVHLAFNMVAFAGIGPMLERGLGSFQLLWLILLLGVIGNELYSVAGVVLSAAPLLGRLRLGDECVVGFSGVLFGLIPVETAVRAVRSYSVLGLVSVPAAAYPWLLLAACQLLVRNVSFLGHLCGLLVRRACEASGH